MKLMKLMKLGEVEKNRNLWTLEFGGYTPKLVKILLRFHNKSS